MRITIERNLLLTKLNLVSHALPVKTSLAVLTGIKMEVNEKEAILIASNSDLSIRTKISYDEMQVEETGVVVALGKMFCDIIRNLNSKDVTIYTEENMLKIEAGKGKYRLNTMNSESYPKINFDTDVEPMKISASLFANIVKNTVGSTAQSEKKPILTGVNFVSKEGVLTAVATDSFRLSRMQVEGSGCGNFTATIPNSALNELLKCIDEKEDIEFYISQNVVGFNFNNTNFVSRIIDSQYPDTSRLIGTEFLYEIEFNRNELLDCADRIMVLSNGASEKEKEITYNVVGLKQIDDKSAMLEITNNYNGEAKEEVALNILKKTDDKLDIKFSGKYFTDALKTFKSDKIKIKFNGPVKPFIIEGDSDKGLIQLILPVRA